MLNITKKILLEPLFHFLLLGGVAYIYFEFFPKEEVSAKIPIAINSYEIKNVQKNLNLENKEFALEYLKYQKILLEEAYSLELHKQDLVINKHLLNKVEQIFSNNKSFEEPSEEQLRSFYKENIVDYSELVSFDLYSIKINRGMDSKAVKTIFSVVDFNPYIKKQTNLSYQDLESKYGKYIALKLGRLSQNSWSEVLGDRVFYVTNKRVADPYPYEYVEDVVYENYKEAFIAKNIQKEYQNIYNKYILEESN